MALTRMYVVAAAWAISFLVQDVLPMKTVAYVTLGICAAAALHALLIRWYVWMLSREIVGPFQVGVIGQRRMFLMGIVGIGLCYFAFALRDGRSFINIVAIEGAYLLGIWLYFRRRELARELRAQVAERVTGAR